MSRADVEFALNLGTPTRFQNSDIPYGHVYRLLDTSLQRRWKICDSATFHQLIPELQDVFKVTLRLSSLVNEFASSPRMLDGHIFHDAVISITYQLVQINPLSAPPLTDRLSNVTHLGLCCFMVTFLAGLDGRLPSLPHLVPNIRHFATRSEEASVSQRETLLLVLIIGRTTVLTDHDDAWIMPIMRESFRCLDVSNLRELQQILWKFPWIHILHDSPGEKLYLKLSDELKIPPLLGI